jgi:hypothetical protein
VFAPVEITTPADAEGRDLGRPVVAPSIAEEGVLDSSWVSLKNVHALFTIESILISKIHEKRIPVSANVSANDSKSFKASLKEIRKLATAMRAKFPQHAIHFEEFSESNPKPTRLEMGDWKKSKKGIAKDMWDQVWSWLMLKHAEEIESRRAVAGSRARNVALRPYLQGVNNQMRHHLFVDKFVAGGVVVVVEEGGGGEGEVVVAGGVAVDGEEEGDEVGMAAGGDNVGDVEDQMDEDD